MGITTLTSQDFINSNLEIYTEEKKEIDKIGALLNERFRELDITNLRKVRAELNKHVIQLNKKRVQNNKSYQEENNNYVADIELMGKDLLSQLDLEIKNQQYSGSLYDIKRNISYAFNLDKLGDLQRRLRVISLDAIKELELYELESLYLDVESLLNEKEFELQEQHRKSKETIYYKKLEDLEVSNKEYLKKEEEKIQEFNRGVLEEAKFSLQKEQEQYKGIIERNLEEKHDKFNLEKKDFIEKYAEAKNKLDEREEVLKNKEENYQEIIKNRIYQEIKNQLKDVNKKDEAGMTALMYAVRFCSTDKVELLLEMGAKPNIKDIRGLTALIYAVKRGKMDMVILLLEKGSHINHRDIRGLTALMHATLLGKQDIVNLLLNPRYKVKINLQCCNGFTALMYAVELEHLEVVEMLLLKNAFIYTRNLVGDTTLDIARMLNHKELVKRLKN